MNYGVKQHDILALSPYQAQCKHIQKKLTLNKLSEVRCTTVKSSEGTYFNQMINQVICRTTIVVHNRDPTKNCENTLIERTSNHLYIFLWFEKFA